jgi:hypothetical protein
MPGRNLSLHLSTIAGSTSLVRSGAALSEGQITPGRCRTVRTLLILGRTVKYTPGNRRRCRRRTRPRIGLKGGVGVTAYGRVGVRTNDFGALIPLRSSFPVLDPANAGLGHSEGTSPKSPSGLSREEQREEVSHKRAQRREVDIPSSRDCPQPSLRPARSVAESKSILDPLNTFPNLVFVFSVLFCV